jgi:hypothetical protein
MADDDLVKLDLSERACLALELSPRFLAIMDDARKVWPSEEWADDLVPLLRIAFGSGIVAAFKEPELLSELEGLGFRVRS